ncbi:MAG: Gfo/Idh/MocA family oxidoreductase [Planctomycetota bacterium]|jgi:predicted dehydrogenase|nr:Gfo/Idh/MocA family oxidoreductase [Planctomycetota bacterium]
MPEKIAAGIIGTGFIGPAHVEAARRLGNVEILAVAEANEELAQQKAAEMSIPRSYGNYQDLLADPDIQVVHNCTPNHLHFEVNRDILAAGKHVISEKPLAMNTTESNELLSLARDSGLIHAVDFNYRFYPLVQHAREMVRSGEIGDVFSIHGSYLQDWLYLPTDWNWRLVPELSGDSRAVADVGSHWCDLMQFISGQSITRVFADLHTVHKTRMRPKKEVETYSGKELAPSDYEPQEINTEDYASVLFEMANGTRGVFTVSQVAAGRKNRLHFELDGSKCAISWDQEKPNEMWIGYRDKANEILTKDPSLLHEAAREYAHYPGGHPEAYPDGPKNLFRNVYRAVANGQMPTDPDWSTFEDGHKEVAICEAVLTSHKNQQWTDVDY